MLKPNYVPNESNFKPQLEPNIVVQLPEDVVIPTHQSKKPKTKKTADKELDYFGAAEHVAIGDTAFYELCEDLGGLTGDFVRGLIDGSRNLAIKETVSPREYKIKLTLNGVKGSHILSAGQIVALAGDFYGVPSAPISFAKSEEDSIANFNAAVDTLFNAPNDEVRQLLVIVFAEEEAVKRAIEKREKPNVVLERLENKHHKVYANITRYSFFPVPWLNLNSRYIELALMNFDHFSEEAEKVYAIGHTQALTEAKKAYDVRDQPNAYWQHLVKAFIFELYGCHFFTDLFAAGHVRTPRKALLAYVQETLRFIPQKTGITGLLAKAMHDEDGQLGVWLYSDKYPSGWLAKGDSCYYEHENQENAAIVCEAVKASLLDVYNTSIGKPVNSKAYRQYIPKPLPRERVMEKVSPSSSSSSSETAGTHFPLFRVRENAVECRENVSDPFCSNYIRGWNPTFILTNIIGHSALKSLASSATNISSSSSAAASAAIGAVANISLLAKEVVEKIMAEVQEEVQDVVEHGCRIS